MKSTDRSRTVRSRTVRSGFLAACSAVALVAGCSSADTDTDPAPEQATSSNEVTIPVTPTTTTVVDAGTEPRRILTFDTADSDEQNVDLTTTSTVSQQINNDASQDFSSPELTVPLSASTSDTVTDDDAATGATRSVELTIGAATSPDEGLTDALSASEGSAARLATTDSGAITALHITPAEAALDTARAAIERSLNAAVYRSIDLPEAEVGVGAVWTVDQQVLSGITLNQRATVTLRALDGDRATLDVALAQTPESTTWNLPDDAGTLNIATYTFTGAGTLEIDLTQPLPVGGSITAGGEQMYTDPDSTTVLRQTVGDSITWSSR
ncbi:hypothetical protein [Rhodococcus sp. ARC_M5]|uniref:hypothetical protein n=1 Tax=Rhodococcus sp. ARC_M5 TaxID=2928851 RepID=UPI001FB3FEC4|nr:hypothetical protein [Rhodococcus sp. ARC_M5]MCJ0893518.1 hypothetical protein [Rhodococcus sp. ARC_M5]